MDKHYELLKVHGRHHVLTEQINIRRTVRQYNGNYIEISHPDANYMGTGKCLCGVLNKGETLEEWILRKKQMREKIYTINYGGKRKNDDWE
jgi:hypothetical protein